jgi:ABC-type multidrug transport system ATPase subunit/ABC-type multidrug transport system permease subunit
MKHKMSTIIPMVEDKPPTPVDFTFDWSDVSFSVTVGKNESKTLLTNMNGSVRSGELCGIMGGSGAGKSTLLSLLTGRVGAGAISGQITLGGMPRNPATWPREYSFVEQEDLLHPELTVTETLMFAAQFRMPNSPFFVKKERVDEVIMDLGLNGCRDTIIGTHGLRGISGGERKRVSIGIELLSFPKLLILDEPTSGLDSFTAFNVLKVVKELAVKRGIAVIMTLHQPRTDILDLLDDILLLAAGKTLYFGPTSAALNHFYDLGFKIPPSTNPSDFFLDIVSLDQRTPELLEASKTRIDLFYKAWVSNNPETKFGFIKVPLKVDFGANPVIRGRLWHELMVLIKRNWLITIRDRVSFIAAVGSSLFVSLIMGMLFFKSGLDSYGIQNRMGVLYFTAINETFSNVIPILGKFDFEKKIARRERSAASYKAWTSFLSKWIVNIPTVAISSLFFALTIYYMVGLNPGADHYLLFLAILVIHSIVSSGLGAFIAAAAPNLDTGQILAPVIVIIFILYGGPLVALNSLPKWLYWFRYISIICNSTGALVQNEFRFVIWTCSKEDILCYTDGEAVIRQFAYDNLDKYYSVGINLVLLAVFLALGATAFERRSRPQMRLN